MVGLRKTAIAVSDELLQAVDTAAARRHESRNRFITHVLAAAVKARNDAEITRRLNEIFADDTTAAEHLAEVAALHRVSSVGRGRSSDDW